MNDNVTLNASFHLFEWNIRGPTLETIMYADASTWFEGWVAVLFILLIFMACLGAGCSKQLVTYVVDPRRETHRYILLFLISLFIPGPYFHDAIIQTFKGPISEHMQLSNSQFGSLFAVSSLTGVFWGPGGSVISRMGRTRSAIILSFFAAVGSTLTTIGYKWDSLFVMLMGRFVFWFSLNGLLMVQTILCYDLFTGRGLNFAMTFIVCSIRFGGSISYPLSGPLLTRLGVRETLWFTVSLVFGAFCSTLIFAKLFRGTQTARAIWPMLEARQAREKFSLALVKKVPISVFFFLGGLDAAWGIVFPFEVIGDHMLQKEFGYSANDAGFIIAIAPLVSILSPLIAPFLGTTLRQKLLACASGLVLLTCAFIIITCRFPILGISLVGIGYAVSVCAFYSTLPMYVSSQVPAEIGKSITSIVVGLNMVGSGLTMIVSNTVIGIIKDRSSYRSACVYLAIVGVCGLFSIAVASILHRPVNNDTSEGSPEAVDSTGGTVVITGSLDITDNY